MTLFEHSTTKPYAIALGSFLEKLNSIRPPLFILLFFVIVGSLGSGYFELNQTKNDLEKKLQNEILNLQNHLNSASSVMVLNTDLTNSVEQGNYAETMRQIVIFLNGKIGDSIIVYDKDGKIFADASAPGSFGNTDEISPLTLRAIKSDKTLEFIISRHGTYFIYNLRSMQSLNGGVGAVAVGTHLDRRLVSVSEQDAASFRELVISRANENRLNQLSFSHFKTLELPADFAIIASSPTFEKQFLIILLRTLGLGIATSLAHQLWSKYSRARDLLKTEEAQRVASSRLVALGEMSAGIAHEINNPLSVILMSSQQLKNLIEDPKLGVELHEKLSKIADRLLKTTDRITKIIDALRTFSRDGSKDAPQPAKIKNLINDALELSSTRIKNKIDLKVNVNNPEETVMCRSVEISQVVMNLVNNSYDAIEALPAPWIEVSTYNKNGFLEISVTDSGSGIPPAIRAKIMEPFFTTKPVGKGTGIGLSISSGIMLTHGGSLAIDESCPNTRFIMRLPLANHAQLDVPHAINVVS